MTAYHTPVFKNQFGNILDHSEQMRSQSSMYKSKKVKSSIDPSTVINDYEEMKHERKTKVAFKDVERRGSKASIKKLRKRLTDSNFSEENSEDFINFSQSYSSKYQSSKEKIEEDTKNSEESLKEIGEEDLLDTYLRHLAEKREVKESPIMNDENRIEVNPHRKSGKSISPNRQSVPKLEPSTTMIKESTNIPLTFSLSSDGNNSGGNQDPSPQEDFIIEELNGLYQVFLSWVFSSRDEVDLSRPIRYSSVLPLCLNLAAKSTKLMKQKVISDFNFMTAIEKNATVIMAERTFSRWIIDLMYTVFPPRKDKDLDPIWEMGCKLYIQMTKMCLNSDTSSHFYIHQLLVWPIIKYRKHRSSKDKAGNDIKRRERMVRTILCSFLDTISSNKEREKWNPSFGRDNPFVKFWRNITQIVFHIEELVLSFEYIRLALSDDSTPMKTTRRKKTIEEEFSSSILERKVDQSLFENTKNYLFLSSVSNNWQDSRLLNMIFEIIEPIWTIKSKRRTSKAHKSGHTMYFKKMGYNQIEDQVLDCLDEIS